MPNVKLLTSDNEIIEADVETIKCSVTLKDLLDYNLDGDIPLPNVRSDILRKILDWANHHKDDPPEENDDYTQRSVEISNWDANLLDVDLGTLYELIVAANYLDIQRLLHMACKTVANMIRGKTTEQLRATFNIVNDFTPEEEEQLRNESRLYDEHIHF